MNERQTHASTIEHEQLVARKILLGSDNYQRLRDVGLHMVAAAAANAARRQQICMCCLQPTGNNKHSMCWPCWIDAKDGKLCPHTRKLLEQQLSPQQLQEQSSDVDPMDFRSDGSIE